MVNKNYTSILVGFFTIIALQSMPALSQTSSANTDETKVKAYTLPDPLIMANGKRVTSAAQWNNIQRPYIYHLFEKNVYGRYRTTPVAIDYRTMESDDHALNGIATRKQLRIFLKPGDTAVFVDVLMYLPNNAKKPTPVFLGYNFRGNATVQPDKAIFLSNRMAG